MTSKLIRFTRGHGRPRSRGQALVETALVLPILLAIVGGIIQFGVAFWAQNTLTQVARDTGRWVATQQFIPYCNSPASFTAIAGEANVVASNSSLIGYDPDEWSSATGFLGTRPAEGVEVEWPIPGTPPGLSDLDCPPSDNQTAWFVKIRVSHVIPTFLPGLQYLPALGTCDSTGCYLSITTTTTFRMEPVPAP
jgi:Flp pilus assembly protein TadG